MRTNRENVKIKYKGFTVEYVENRFNHKTSVDESVWILEDSEENRAYENTSLSKVQDYIDRLIKTDFKEFNVFIQSYSEDFYIVTVTSIDEEGNLWVKNKDGRRTKIRPSDAILDTVENRAILCQLKETENNLKVVENTITKLTKSLKTYGK